MNKVGLVTYYGDNYGACLQAYALQTSIKNLGYECAVIEYNITYDNRSNKKSFVKKLIDVLKTGNPINRYKTRQFVLKSNVERHKDFESFRKENLIFSNNGYTRVDEFYNAPPQFDLYLCGSDQIWNPSFYGRCNPIYYLDFVPDNKKRVSYAPSVGVTEIEDSYEDNLSKYLNKFNYISVREDSSVELLKKYTDKEIKWVLDPTLLLNFENYKVLKNKVKIPAEPYIFCYLFGTESNIKVIKDKITKELNMKVVSIPFVSREILSDDIKLSSAGPEDFVHLIKNAALVVTDSFHATAFSINFKTPFVSLFRQKETEKNEMSSRLKSILKKMHLENRLIRNVEELPEDLLNMDFTESKKLLNQYRKESTEFLKTALSGEKDYGNM